MLELLESPVLWVAPALLLLLVYFSSMGGLSGKKKRDRIARVNRKSRPMLQLGTQSLRRLKPGEDTAFGQVLASMQSIAKLRARLEVAGLTETTPVSLAQLLKKGPAIVVFYRGGWCPYCNLELRAYQRLLPEIKKAGGQLIAISPQAPDTSLNTTEKNALTYPVLSDIHTDAAKGFGILFTLPDYLQKLYSSLGHGLDVVNANGAWTLPVPATFVIGTDGSILARHVDTDYRKRMEPADALAAIQRAAGQHAA